MKKNVFTEIQMIFNIPEQAQTDSMHKGVHF